jgi:hypothetical protein
MPSIKMGAAVLVALTLMSSQAFAWGSHPDEANDKLNTIIEKDQEDATNKALDSITEQLQEENNTKVGGKQS